MSLYDLIRSGPLSGSASSLSVEERKRQFLERIKLNAYADQFIDRQEEHRLLEQAVDLGMTLEEGLALIAQFATEQGYGVERLLEERARDTLAVAANDKKGVEKAEFEAALQEFLRDAKGVIPPAEAARRLKKIVLDQRWKVKEGGLFGSKWFSAIT